MYQKTCIFHLILLWIPSSLVLSVNKFVDDPLRKRFLKRYLKSKTNKIFKVLLGQITSTMNSFVVVAVCVFFQFSNDLAIIT